MIRERMEVGDIVAVAEPSMYSLPDGRNVGSTATVYRVGEEGLCCIYVKWDTGERDGYGYDRIRFTKMGGPW